MLSATATTARAPAVPGDRPPRSGRSLGSATATAGSSGAPRRARRGAQARRSPPRGPPPRPRHRGQRGRRRRWAQGREPGSDRPRDTAPMGCSRRPRGAHHPPHLLLVHPAAPAIAATSIRPVVIVPVLWIRTCNPRVDSRIPGRGADAELGPTPVATRGRGRRSPGRTDGDDRHHHGGREGRQCSAPRRSHAEGPGREEDRHRHETGAPVSEPPAPAPCPTRPRGPCGDRAPRRLGPTRVTRTTSDRRVDPCAHHLVAGPTSTGTGSP